MHAYPSIAALRKAYTSGRLTPEALIEQLTAQAAEEESYNIWITPPSLSFIQPYLDRLKDLPIENAPLWGIPFALKDNIDLAGVPTTAGCEAYSYIPEEHAAAAARLIEAGAVPVGKTNLDQFATGLVGTRSPYGETKNAWDPDLISGGSSSGSAVSVAAGQALFALGTDTAGSGRVPAALNNLVGWKSSLGSWPVSGIVPACASIDCLTVFTHTMEDAALVDSIIRGFDETDPWSRNTPELSETKPQSYLLPDKEPAFFGPFAEAYRQAWKQTVAALEQSGLPINYVSTAFMEEAASVLYDGPLVAERWAELGGFADSHPGALLPVTEKVLRSGTNPDYTAASLFQAKHQLKAYTRKAEALLQNSVLIMPTAGGTWSRNEVRENPIQTNSDMGRYTNHCNLLELCAVSLPQPFADSRLPFGITLFSSQDNDSLLVGASREIQRCRRKEVTVAVCGLHMRGFALEEQMISHEAYFVKETMSASSYKLVEIPGPPAKPGMIRSEKEGVPIALELWSMPLDQLGSFTSGIPSPLGIGKVELEDGTFTSGFICEAEAAEYGKDITSFGGWKAYQNSLISL